MPISAGELCTLTTGILNQNIISVLPGPTIAVDPLLKDLKTYNQKKDTESGRSKQICKMETVTKDGKDNEVAWPQCSISHGVGTIMLTTPDPIKRTCQTYACPTDWVQNENDPLQCQKPGVVFNDGKVELKTSLRGSMYDYRASAGARCDERWQDWFLIPNYHHSNVTLRENENVCMAPCPSRYVPYYNTDPVDGDTASFVIEDKPNRCVSKELFFSGKYAGNDDFCPLAVIHRLNSTKDKVKIKLQDMYAHYGSNLGAGEEKNEKFNELLVQNIDATAERIANEAQSYTGVVTTPNAPGELACSRLNTVDRLNEAYEVCERVKANTYEASGPNTIPMLQKACAAVFCNNNSSALDIVSKQQICFDKFQPIVPEDPVYVDPPRADKEYRFIISCLYTGIFIIGTTIQITLFYYLWTKYLWPRWFRRAWRWLRVRFGGADQNLYDYLDTIEKANAEALNYARKNKVDPYYAKRVIKGQITPYAPKSTSNSEGKT